MHNDVNIEAKAMKLLVFTPLPALPSSASPGSGEQGRCGRERRRWRSVNGCGAAPHLKTKLFLSLCIFGYSGGFSDQEECLICPRILNGARSPKPKIVSTPFSTHFPSPPSLRDAGSLRIQRMLPAVCYLPRWDMSQFFFSFHLNSTWCIFSKWGSQ